MRVFYFGLKNKAVLLLTSFEAIKYIKIEMM